MSVTGLLLDVSGSMKNNIGGGVEEDGKPWAQSIFCAIDDLIKHDLTSENRIFAIGFGAEQTGSQVFDIISTLYGDTSMMTTHEQSVDNAPAKRDDINNILDILEQHGARNIRTWVSVELIEKVIDSHLIAIALDRLMSEEEFPSIFVQDILPPGCRNKSPAFWPAEMFEDLGVFAFSYIVPKATEKDIKTIVEKTVKYFKSKKRLVNVGSHSIYSVQDASRIIRGCVGEKEVSELSEERKKELLEQIEPYIYGGTPLFESLEKATRLFEQTTAENKLLFVLSDGEPADGRHFLSVEHFTSRLARAGVYIVSCYITETTDISAKHLYDEMDGNWEIGAKFLFSLSSKLLTQDLPLGFLIKNDWKIDIDKNETNLFIQANHPDNLREACRMAKEVVGSADTLSELLVSVDLDIYIRDCTRDMEAEEQILNQNTCYAFASAAVLHLRMQGVYGPEGVYPEFDMLKDEMIAAHGVNGANTGDVLQKICEKYGFKCEKVFKVNKAKKAIVEKRPVVATFHLPKKKMKSFKDYFRNNPTGILTLKEMTNADTESSDKTSPPTIGHAVVLTSYNSKCLKFMNSWGQEWGDNGFFRVENAEVLGDKLEFFDVSWDWDKATEGEKEYYRKHAAEVAAKLMSSLKGLQNAEYTCPKCEKKSLVTEFEGTLSKALCPKCQSEFSTNDKKGNIVALNVYLASLSN
ncbi:uncharacterized protein LOC114533385 [Dendronephthya gigantea]|uniref:uncharacterized protein LOC114533385 n=1 Tax=Dendronephthya gigantea TaxID=151771 RepID=UPI00106C8E9D|nr:uncharacterized protein LOC114533385 [Dendronephthya gigantea]